MISSSKQLLRNITDIPPKNSAEHDDFWKNETKKVEYGVTIDGVNISGWLYWHTQLWNITIDIEDPINKMVRRVFEHSHFRDNEWIIAEALQEAETTRKGMMLFGSRRLGKSEFLASYIARKAIIFENSENAVTGGNWQDIDIITDKISRGIDALPDWFRFGKTGTNPRKEIGLGFKDKKGNKLPWSKIIVRNFEDGINTEAAAGITASSFVIDEIGKFPFAKSFEAAKPAFTSPFGWRCSPILTGTSGDIKKSSDAEKFFNNPEAFNFIVRELKEEGNKKVSVFISGLYRMEGKVKTTIGDYVKRKSGILVPEYSELNEVTFEESDFVLAEAVIDGEREQAAKSPDPTALLKATMYYPKNTKELFLSDDGNKFPVEAMTEHLAYLQANPEQQGQNARLYRSADGKVCISYNTNKVPILDYPLKDSQSKDACIVIYEPPDETPTPYLYVSGADPYNQASSKWSTSLGSIYIYKRVMDPISGTFQRRIVASYTARPESMKEFHDNVEMLLELYNCICLPENEAGTFVQYFDQKNKGYMLADGYNFLREIHPTTSITNRPKGLPATVPVQRFYKELVYTYLTEKIQVGVDEKGDPITKLGCVRIPDIGLLKELINYNDDGNFDRYVAFGHTLAHELWADKIYPFTFSEYRREETKPDENMKRIISPFDLRTTSSPFARGNKNPFGL